MSASRSPTTPFNSWMPGGKKTKVWMLPTLSVVMDDSRNHWQICISSCALPIKQMGPWGQTQLLSCCCGGETGQATESVGSERWCEGDESLDLASTGLDTFELIQTNIEEVDKWPNAPS